VTDSNGGKKRPNANYKLSKSDNAPVSQEELNFYYNREHRLAKAPKNVQDLYKEKKPNRFGFLGILVADPPRRILLATILLMCAVIWLFSLLGYVDTSYNFDGNLVKISAIDYEGAVIVVVNKTVKNKNVYTGAVDIAVSVPIQTQGGEDKQTENDYTVFYHRLFFSLEKHERYSFAVPFESDKLLLVLQTEKKTLKITVPVDKADTSTEKKD
jgi:hypothetical protein